MLQYKKLIDISQPVKADSAAFPGDTHFKREIVLTYEKSNVVNLTALTMSPHIGTHVDAPSHIKGDLHSGHDMVGSLPLEPFIGQVLVINLAPTTAGVSWESVKSRIDALNKSCDKLPERLLIRTQEKIRYEVFEDDYSYFTPELVRELSARGVRLIGIDTPSADHVNAKVLVAHQELDKAKMTWLENLDLTEVEEGEYMLIAFPIKFMELEASPVRAVLLQF